MENGWKDGWSLKKGKLKSLEKLPRFIENLQSIQLKLLTFFYFDFSSEFILFDCLIFVNEISKIEYENELKFIKRKNV